MMESQKKSRKACFVGSVRCRQPLGPTDEKKFRALQELGELFVIGFSQDLRPRRFTQHVHFFLFPHLPWTILRYVQMFIGVPLLLLWLIVRHDVRIFIAQSPYEGASAAFVKLLASWFHKRVVLVVESHGNFEEDIFGQKKIIWPQLYRFLMNYAARFTFHCTDLLRAISHSTRQQLERWCPGKKIVQFMAWTDIDVFLHAGNTRNRNDFRPIFLYAGVLIPRKGVLHLVKAFTRIAPDFPDSQLILIGKEEHPEYVAEIKTILRQEHLEQRVQFVSPVEQQELARWIAQACAFILPSHSEGLGRVVVEAMATGTPIIGSRVGGIPDMIEDGVTGFLVPPGDEIVLAEKLRWCLEHRELSQELGKNAYLFARSFFSTKLYVKGYQEILETAQELLQKRDHAASVV